MAICLEVGKVTVGLCQQGSMHDRFFSMVRKDWFGIANFRYILDPKNQSDVDLSSDRKPAGCSITFGHIKNVKLCDILA